MSLHNFSASFTAGALLYNEFLSLLSILKKPDYVLHLNKEKEDNKLLKINTESARIRVITEIKKRVRSVQIEFWDFLSNQPEHQQRLALYYLILKAHPLAFDFHFEVVMKRWKSMQFELEKIDIKMRLDEISSSAEEVDSWSESTKTKTITQFIRILREAGLMKKNKLINPKIFDNSFWQYFIQIGDVWFLEACFLTKSERDSLL